MYLFCFFPHLAYINITFIYEPNVCFSGLLGQVFFFSPFIDLLDDGGWRATHTPSGGRKKDTFHTGKPHDTFHAGKPNNTFHTGNKISSKGVFKGKEQFSRCSWTFF